MKLFCITGMHRSGTSMVSRVANLIGLELGPARELVPPQPANPRGHWENELLTLFNDRLLSEFGGTWDAPPALENGWQTAPELAPLKRRARALLAARFAGASLAGWKDPRNSLLLPFWQEAHPIAGTIFCLRQPGAVAASLRARNGFDSERSAELWILYVLGWQLHAPDGLVLDYERFFDEREAVVRELAGFLGLGEPSSEALREVAAHVDPKLRHHGSDERAEGPCAELANEIYRGLRSGQALPEELARRARQAAESAQETRGDRARSLASELGFRIDQELALLAHRDELIDERDVAIRQRDELAAHRDDLIRQRDVAIAQRDELIHGDQARAEANQKAPEGSSEP
jgi:hypothetical protein